MIWKVCLPLLWIIPQGSASAYFSSQSATLPATFATGRLTLQPESIVYSVIYDEAKGKAISARYVDRTPGAVREVMPVLRLRKQNPKR